LGVAVAGDKNATSDLFELCGVLMQSITTLRCPVIAKVNGMATAAGCQLVASCDLAIATTESRFATPGVNIGLFCSTPAVALSRAVGRKAAMEMLLTGDAITSEQAVAFGLINRAVPKEDLDETVDALATQIASKAGSAINIGKAAFNQQLPLPLSEAYAQMGEVMTNNTLNEDANEGIGAFLGKRHPEWKMQ
jgi:enoyl-CoA hydratase/carnithine racemase